MHRSLAVAARKLLSRPTGLSKIRASPFKPPAHSLHGSAGDLSKARGMPPRNSVAHNASLCASNQTRFLGTEDLHPVRYRKKIWAAWKRPTSYRGREIPETAISQFSKSFGLWQA